MEEVLCFTSVLTFVLVWLMLIGHYPVMSIILSPAEGISLAGPLVSVITIVYNDVNNLEATILSVLKQNYQNIEYVIIDGGSDDGTVDLLEKYEDRIAYWISAKDNGISDAFNKGLAASNGEIINFLNSADMFAQKDSVATCARHFMDDSVNIVTAYAKHQNSTIPKRPIENSAPLYRKAKISHQASFVRRKVFKKVGGFSEQRKIRMDYDFWLRALRQYEFVFEPEVLVTYAEGGISGQKVSLFYLEEALSNLKWLPFSTFLYRLPLQIKRLLANWIRLRF